MARKSNVSNDAEVTVERSFPVNPVDAPALGDAIEALGRVDGVLAAEPLGQRSGVLLTYDVRRLNAAQVLEQLRALGVRPAGGLWQRWRMSWATMVDRNIRDNAAHHPACCSKPPRGQARASGAINISEQRNTT